MKRLYFVLLAALITSSIFLKSSSGMIGANGSSVMMRAFIGMSVKMVGSKK